MKWNHLGSMLEPHFQTLSSPLSISIIIQESDFWNSSIKRRENLKLSQNIKQILAFTATQILHLRALKLLKMLMNFLDAYSTLNHILSIFYICIV